MVTSSHPTVCYLYERKVTFAFNPGTRFTRSITWKLDEDEEEIRGT